MNDYTNLLNDNVFESIDERKIIKTFIENINNCPLFNDDDEEDNLIYKTKDINNNNLSRLVTCEYSPNNLCEIENVEINNTNNYNLSALQKTSDSNNYIQTQAELFVIPSVNFNNNLNKEKKILGRKKKNSSSTIQSKRNKFSKDNLIHKFKTMFYQKFLIILMNNLISLCGLGKDVKIRKVNNEFIKDLKINLNLDILKKTIADYFSFEISKKYSKQEKNSNENIINKLKKISNEKFNKLLNAKIEDIYNIFINNDCVQIISNEFGIDLYGQENNSLNYFLSLEEEPIYRKCLENACKNIYSFFDKKKARKLLK